MERIALRCSRHVCQTRLASFQSLNRRNLEIFVLIPGTPCNDYSGYCDVFQMCREVDPSGPLATLRKLLLSEESIAGFKKWIMHYWYAVAAILVAIISLLVSSNIQLEFEIRLRSTYFIHYFSQDTGCQKIRLKLT